MRPSEFKQCNGIYAENQPQYLPLPVHRVKAKEGEVISCWLCDFTERLKILFTGRIYLSCLTFNNPLQPQLPSTKFDPLTEAEITGGQNGDE